MIELETLQHPLATNQEFQFEKFKQNAKIEIINMADEFLEFDIMGVDVAIVNALRRIILSDIPTCAIEKVHIYNNTSIIPDEILSHRLGLVPIKIESTLIEMLSETSNIEDLENLPETQTVLFELKCKCRKDSNETVHNATVTSGMLKWVPIGNQTQLFGDNPPIPLHDDIVIAKLIPSQKLTQHKANVSYRYYPEIILKTPIYGDDARLLKNYFSPGVIELVKNKKHNVEAKVVNVRIDSNSRNVKHDEKLKDLVFLGRRPNHFIFTIESIGIITPQRLIKDSINLLKLKSELYMNELNLENC